MGYNPNTFNLYNWKKIMRFKTGSKKLQIQLKHLLFTKTFKTVKFNPAVLYNI